MEYEEEPEEDEYDEPDGEDLYRQEQDRLDAEDESRYGTCRGVLHCGYDVGDY